MKYYSVILLVCLWFIQSNAQSFDIHISSALDEVIFDAVEDYHGNFYLAGHKALVDAQDQFLSFEVYLIKMNTNGQVIKEKTLSLAEDGDVSGIIAAKIILLPDSNLLVGSMRKPDANSDQQLWLIKLDQEFNIIWEKTYGQPTKFEFLTDLLVNKRGEIIVLGGVTNGVLPIEFMAYQIGIEGDSINSIYQNTPNGFTVNALLEIPNDLGYYAFTYGMTGGTSPGAERVHLDTLLNIVSITPLLNGTWFSPSAITLNDSTYIYTSERPNFNDTIPPNIFQLRDIAVVTQNFEGETLHSTHFGIPDTVMEMEAFDAIDFKYKDAIYLGATSGHHLYGQFFGEIPNHLLLAKTDTLALQFDTFYWQKFYGGDAYYHLLKVLATYDGGALLIGTRYDHTATDRKERDIYVLKVNENGEVSTSISDPDILPKQDYKVYPNPAKDILNVEAPNISSGTFKLFDMTGRLLFMERF